MAELRGLSVKVPIKFSERAQRELYKTCVAYKELAELRGAENAKLRELCTEMFGDLDALIGEDDMMLIGDGSSQRLFSRNNVDAYRNRMRELGIVVDDESV